MRFQFRQCHRAGQVNFLKFACVEFAQLVRCQLGRLMRHRNRRQAHTAVFREPAHQHHAIFAVRQQQQSHFRRIPGVKQVRGGTRFLRVHPEFRGYRERALYNPQIGVFRLVRRIRVRAGIHHHQRKKQHRRRLVRAVDADERLPGHSTVNRLRRFCTCHLCNIERVLKQPPSLLRIHLPHKLYCAPDQLVLPSVIRRILRRRHAQHQQHQRQQHRNPSFHHSTSYFA